MSLNKKCNKIYILLDVNNKDNDKIIYLFKKIDIFKSIGVYNIDEKSIYISFNFNDKNKKNDEELLISIQKINDILITFNIDKSIYYNFNGNKSIIYKPIDNPILKPLMKAKTLFIDDD